ncbi:MAG: hypothetical protein EWV79_00200 [Microcystis aeruginosa Ma_MB_S_20031200_S102D]|nr:MAG: hypothetical protein EWV79_00200 [Microcystis aeruginosa Ma_MB_S_20031200_S102D]
MTIITSIQAIKVMSGIPLKAMTPLRIQGQVVQIPSSPKGQVMLISVSRVLMPIVALVGDNIQINGYWGNDNITGSTGNDLIIGGGGDDILNGGNGEDTLIGGLGSDQLTGGEGRDSFIFNTVDEIGQGANQDNILDFNTDLDTIDISGIDANSLNDGNESFTFIGASDFSGQAGQLRFDGGLLCGDTNGDAVSDFQLAVAGVYSLPVTNIVL